MEQRYRSPSNDFRLLLAGLPAQQFGFIVCSRQTGIVFNPGGAQGNLCLGGDIGRAVGGVIFSGGFFGTADVVVDVNDLPQPTGNVAAMAGETWNFLRWFRDFVGGVHQQLQRRLADHLAIARLRGDRRDSWTLRAEPGRLASLTCPGSSSSTGPRSPTAPTSR